MKGRALLFGLNYMHCANSKLNGCINDVYSMAEYIKKTIAIPTTIFTDDVDLYNTSYDGIIKNLYEIAVQSYKEELDFIWIHYSGHGSNQKDTSGDELDGMDEGLVPSDYEKKGILIDDVLNHVFKSFNPNTKILFVCDACHSGTMIDLKYSWNINRESFIENANSEIKAQTILISGCQDNQTSADAYNVMGDNKYVGAMTASFLKIIKNNPEYINNVFKCVEAMRLELQKGSYSQIPCISTNYDILKNPSMILIEDSKINVQYDEASQYPYQNYNNQEPSQQTEEYYQQPQQQTYYKPQQYYQQTYYKPQPPQQYYQQPQQQTYYKPPQYLQQYFYKPQQYLQQPSQLFQPHRDIIHNHQQYYQHSPSNIITRKPEILYYRVLA